MTDDPPKEGREPEQIVRDRLEVAVKRQMRRDALARAEYLRQRIHELESRLRAMQGELCQAVGRAHELELWLERHGVRP